MFSHIFSMRILLVALTIFLTSCQGEDLESQKGDLEISQGGFLSSKELSDEVIVLNIWADWCPPCIKEMPYFNKLDKLPEVTVLGFHFDQFDLLDEAELIVLIEKLGMDFANLKTYPRDIWGIDIPGHVPTIIIIKDNVVVKTMITPQTYESLLEAIEVS